jgi:hypothetical protein
MTSRALLTSLCVAGALVLVPAAARADQYVVDHCQTPDGAPAIAFGALSGQTSNNCSAPGGGLHHQEGTSMLPNSGDVRQIVLSIPADRPNLQVERVISTFSMPGAPPSQPNGPNGFPFLSMYNGNHDVIYNAQAQGVPIRPTVDLTLPPNNRSLTWEALCGGSACTWFDQNILNVYGTRLYLDEAVAPALTVTGGTLTAPGSKSATMSFGYDAADADSGVSSLSVALDGTIAGSVKFPCAFNDWSACPRDEKSQLLQVDTTKVPDGNHELLVTLRDAANNALTRSLGVVTVANGGVSVPNGANPSRLAKITARFTTSKKRSRRLRYTASPTVKGVLVDEQGQPISGATVAVLARLKQSGARDAQAATAQTGADGGFSLKLPSGASRTITFAYTAFSGDAKPAATARLRTTVRASIAAQIAPRSVRAGKGITLSGKLGPLPRKGIEVKIQARQGSTWRTIDDVRTTSGGSLRWRYRFPPRQARRTYAFRARVASQNYPFAAASSNAVLVRVR